jgi:MOB kinase activator 1
MFGRLFDKNKTFRPKKKLEKGTKRYDLHKIAKETLGSGDLRAAVVLPPGEDLQEWLAVNTLDFYNTTNLLYGSITEYCTPTECPTMSAGTKYEYLWADGVHVKKPIRVSASEYVELLMRWIEDQINDDKVFPSAQGEFPKNFVAVVKNIFKRLFRVYAHIYYSHFAKIQALGEEAHLNTCFKHFVLFVFEFDLIDKKELAPMKEVILNLLGPRYADSV